MQAQSRTSRPCEGCGTVFIPRGYWSRTRPARFCSSRCANSRRRPKADRLWPRVDRSGDGCWCWTGPVTEDGYGKFDKTLAHRAAWEVTYGPVPPGMEVLHTCDNPPCCRPDHLFVGTQLDNMHDMIAKGRDVPLKGQRNGRAKLTDVDVLAIRQRREAGEMLKALAAAYGVRRFTIIEVLQGRAWSHV